ncbi:MAG: polyprenyl synthetase family protein, partial [Bacteroidota bacterium]
MSEIRRPIVPSIDSIKTPVEAELRQFNGFFREAMRSKVGLVDLVARYLVRQKGKRVRPILVFLS